MTAAADSSAEQAEQDLRQALRILSTPGKYQPEEWLLIATLIIDADRVIRENRLDDSPLRLQLFDEVMEALRDLTMNFTDAEFLRASRAARRHRPELFVSKRRNP
jgi:hypothetical protein